MFKKCSKGLGDLEAYTDVEEGVAFQMDNNLFWDSLGSCFQLAIEGMCEKTFSCKFWVISLPSGRVLIKDWLGMYLAPVEEGTDVKTYPVQPVQYTEDRSLQFDVFHRDNRVAFQAYNRRFLARVQRGEFQILEAAKFLIDSTCYFRPQIGDICLPTFEIKNVVPKELWRVKCRPTLVDRMSYTNRGETPIQQTFIMDWNIQCTDKVFWNHLWGLGLPSVSSPFVVENAKLTVKYLEDNQRVVSVTRNISETVSHTLMVPPRTKAIAYLYARQQSNASLPFTAVIRKVTPRGKEVILQENGAWTGLVYRDLWIYCSLKRLDELCPWIEFHGNWSFAKEIHGPDRELPSSEEK
uniref:Uncharacterized protein n=1 Tax=Pogona vitticeps TaxID=103695 RepID=A0A6J0U035_9SAUR